MFPGQGSQYKGMGAELFERFPTELEMANELMKQDIKNICLEDPNGLLSETQYTQPCLYFVNCLHYLALKEDNNVRPNFLCGHSLGEYTALFAANVYDLYTGFKIVKKRGELMSSVKAGILMAILGDKIDQITNILNEEGITNIDVANYNTSEQLVIGGTEEDLKVANEILEKHGYRCVILNVSGAFHTRYMIPARASFMKYLINFKFNSPNMPVVCSSTMEFFDPRYAIETLGYQITKSVNWVNTINKLRFLGVRNFQEVGPKEVLTRMTNKIL